MPAAGWLNKEDPMTYHNDPRRAKRKRLYPEYWDYRSPRTAQEYLDNNYRRRRNAARRFGAFVQRLFAFGVAAFVLALLI